MASASAHAAEAATCATVLVVDDDPGVREVLTDLLREAGHEVVCVEGARAALEYLRSHPAPRLILLDLWMPGMSGMEFRAVQVREPAWADIPVIVITAAIDGCRQAERLGAAGVLEKPVHLDDLLGVVAARVH